MTGGRPPGVRPTLAIRLGSAVGLVGATVVALVALDPIGPLRGPLLLVVALPIMAHALAVTGWVPILAAPFRRLRPGVPAVLATYIAWLVLSAFLTLDVAAVVAVPVGLAVAKAHGVSGRSQVGSAVVGANVGSLILPFSNLTNIVLVAGTGMAFSTYVETAWLPQLAAAVGAGAVLAYRARRLHALGEDAVDRPDTPESQVAEVVVAEPVPLDAIGILAGIVAVASATVAVVVGFGGGDVATVLTIGSAVIAALVVADGRLAIPGIVAAISVPAILVILGAALLREPIAALASGLPVPDPATIGWIAFPAAALVGGGLSAIVNNLPAAAFGAIWLHLAGAPIVIAYLIGTNVLALVTPHGSVATMLARTLAHRGGVRIGPRDYLSRAWPYAVAGTIPALAVLAVVR